MWLWFLLLAAAIVIIVFGDSPSFRNTFINKVRNKLIAVNTRIISSFNYNYDSRLNYAVPLFYLVVISFCFYQFFTQSWFLLTSSIKYSSCHQWYIFLSIISTYSFTFISMFSNPGYINNHNLPRVLAKFPFNEIIYFKNNFCSTCKFEKPARSKHCSTCNRCVMLFDHHCVWVNNCIGYYNYKYFMAWLVANINFMVYGNYILLHGMPLLPLRSFKNLIGEDDRHKITGIFIILCTIFSVVVVLFTGLQIRYVYLGITTNELDKWGEVEYLVSIGTLYRKRSNNQLFELVDNDKLLNMKNDQVFPVFDDLVKIKNLEEIDNIYDKGFQNNLMEKLFPEDLETRIPHTD